MKLVVPSSWIYQFVPLNAPEANAVKAPSLILLGLISTVPSTDFNLLLSITQSPIRPDLVYNLPLKYTSPLFLIKKFL